MAAPSNGALLCSAGKSHESEVHYHPFRMTPYLAQVQEQPGAESQPCCVLLAERVHSGYEGSRLRPASGPWVLRLLPGFRRNICKEGSSPAPQARAVSVALGPWHASNTGSYRPPVLLLFPLPADPLPAPSSACGIQSPQQAGLTRCPFLALLAPQATPAPQNPSLGSSRHFATLILSSDPS